MHLGSYIALHFVKNREIWDVGHAMLGGGVPALRPVAEIMTCATPFALLFANPGISKMNVAKSAIRRWIFLVFLRSVMVVCTVLPSLHAVPETPSIVFGHGRDYIFSGHTAFVASWILEYHARSAFPSWMLIAWSAASATAIVATRMHYTIDVVLAWVLAVMASNPPPSRKPTIRFVDDIEEVHALRHRVYATELRQYEKIEKKDDGRDIIGAFVDDRLVGFVFVTPPGGPYAMERHVPVAIPSDSLFEISSLTVAPEHRRSGIARALMYAAYRYGDCLGATELIVMARTALISLYEKIGLKELGPRFSCGEVEYTVMHGRDDDLFLDWSRGDLKVDWHLPFCPNRPTRSFHGGRSMTLAGSSSRCDDVIQADVLDAWYPPSPAASSAAADARLFGRSPPHDAAELVDAISKRRGIPRRRIVLGNGSSDLIYRCFLEWLDADSRVYLPRPTYSEYVHILRRVIGCRIDTTFDESASYDMMVFVNPNSPTGFHDPNILDIVKTVPKSTRVWVDETYVDFAGSDLSIEHAVGRRRGLVVCKSMSKVYALSGLRVAYACMHETDAEAIRLITPPWTPSGPAQAAAIAALRDVEYYEDRILETRAYRKRLEEALTALGYSLACDDAVANFVTIFVDDAPRFRAECIERGMLYTRDVSEEFGRGAIRIAVGDTDRIITAIMKVPRSQRPFERARS
jgi:histidinol-phosphate/aromatic aminotransferase/cobyric acid decarboxylase-like protein/ribosomal protein S18 acetylase RimI-like enzyme